MAILMGCLLGLSPDNCPEVVSRRSPRVSLVRVIGCDVMGLGSLVHVHRPDGRIHVHC